MGFHDRSFAHDLVIRPIPPGRPNKLFFVFKPLLHNCYNSGCGMYYHVCVGNAYKRSLPANKKRIAHEVLPRGFLSLFEWFFIMSNTI